MAHYACTATHIYLNPKKLTVYKQADLQDLACSLIDLIKGLPRPIRKVFRKAYGPPHFRAHVSPEVHGDLHTRPTLKNLT